MFREGEFVKILMILIQDCVTNPRAYICLSFCLFPQSFYLPGSVDTRDKQLEDWNLKPPPLYLWSRPDWTSWHMQIAQMHRHIKYDVYNNNNGKEVTNYLMEENHDCYQNYPGLHAPNNFLSIFDGVPDDNGDIVPENGATRFP